MDMLAKKAEVSKDHLDLEFDTMSKIDQKCEISKECAIMEKFNLSVKMLDPTLTPE